MLLAVLIIILRFVNNILEKRILLESRIAIHNTHSFDIPQMRRWGVKFKKNKIEHKLKENYL